jgi:hypothetical protein
LFWGVSGTSTRYQVPGTWCQVPGTWQLGTRYLLPGTRYLVPGTRYQVPGTCYLVPGTRYQVPATRYETSFMDPCRCIYVCDCFHFGSKALLTLEGGTNPLHMSQVVAVNSTDQKQKTTTRLCTESSLGFQRSHINQRVASGANHLDHPYIFAPLLLVLF